MIKLDNALRRHFRTIGHQLKPVVTVSNKGLTENIINEANRALENHELIKVKLSIADRLQRQEIATSLIGETHSEKVDIIGKVLLCYRPAKNPNVRLSNILRHFEQTRR